MSIQTIQVSCMLAARTPISGVWGCCLIYVTCASLCAQSPTDPPDYSESSLPAYYQHSPSDVVGLAATGRASHRPSSTLPSESTLPGQTPVVAALSSLPSESQLPKRVSVTAQQAPQGGPAIEDLADILAASRDRVPWLRLIEAEHTAPIRVLELDASGKNLFTAGEDKIVHHWKWNAQAQGNHWQHHATYRWQVQRAELGTILSLTSHGDELFIAGAGADGQQGEIVAVNTQTGAWLAPLVDAQRGHHTPVLRTCMLPEGLGRRLISIDQQHGIGLWTQEPNLGTWNFRALRTPQVGQQSKAAPIDVFDARTMVSASTNTAWSIEFTNVDTGAVTRQLRRDAPLANSQAVAHALQLASEHFRSIEGRSYATAQLTPLIRDTHGQNVTSLAVSTNNQMVAAGDNLGFLYVWNSNGQLTLKTLASFTGFHFRHLAFSRTGRYLAATAFNPLSSTSIVQLWQLTAGQPPTLLREIRRPASMAGGLWMADESGLVLATGRKLEWLPLEQKATPQAIPERTSIALPSQVVFARELPYQWKIDFDQAQLAFDGLKMQWLEAADIGWREVANSAKGFALGPWTIAAQANSPQAAPEVWMMRGNQRMARLDLDQHFRRRPESQIQHVAWIQTPQGQPAAVAVTLSGQNDIWVFGMPADDSKLSTLIRVFAGHEGAVQSLDCSPDARYLISCSQDCTVRLWPLLGLPHCAKDEDAAESDLPTSAAPVPPTTTLGSRSVWGFDFSIDQAQVTANQPYFTGPLYLKGMRSGDRIEEISYEQFQPDGTLRRTTLVNPQEILAFLRQPRFDLAVRFIFSRGGVEVPGFQAYAHWREIAAQTIAANREWAMWTPTGFYDASFNGNSLFGWQINRGLQQEPDFYRADRFAASLERPNFMRRLLTAGSIEQASELAGQLPIGFGHVLEHALALQPRVKILSPTANQILSERQLTIRAEVRMAAGQQLASSKAFVSGVPAGNVRQLSHEQLADGQQRIELSWEANIPADLKLQLQVLCATREKLVGADTIQLSQSINLESPAARRWPGKPKLILLSVGISDYRDSRIPSLELGAANAEGFMGSMMTQAESLYEVIPLALTNRAVTPSVWKSTVRQLQDKLRHIGPDDLIILFVSGHGLIDATSGEYYFVTSHARYSDLVRGNYRDCLSFQELMAWVDVPCRKIAVLDTCHSGAIQTLDSQHLKQAIRTLQSDMVLTLTASEGNQLAAEYRGAQASLFTAAIQQSLQQRPDSDGDGRFEWSELVGQVRKQVTAQSLAGNVPQFPTAGPKDLLQIIELPIALVPAARLAHSSGIDHNIHTQKLVELLPLVP
jgi:WD40 repeat protein